MSYLPWRKRESQGCSVLCALAYCGKQQGLDEAMTEPGVDFYCLLDRQDVRLAWSPT